MENYNRFEYPQSYMKSNLIDDPKMSVVDSMKLRWRLLDDRKRKFAVGLAIITIITIVSTLFFVGNGSSEQPELLPEPAAEQATTPLPTPQQPTPVAPSAPYVPPILPTEKPAPSSSATRPPLPHSGGIVGHLHPLKTTIDKHALASFAVSVLEPRHSNPIDVNNWYSLDISPVDSSTGDRVVTFKSVHLVIKITFATKQNGKLLVNAKDVSIKWPETGKVCSVQTPTQMFRSEQTQHYRCRESATFNCVVSNTKETGSLKIDYFEIEIERARPVDEAFPRFETVASQCPRKVRM